MLLKCTNVVLSSRRKNNDHLINYEMHVPRALPVRNDTLCEHGGHQFNLGQNNKRLTVCSYQRRVLIDVREFIGDRPIIKAIQLPDQKIHKSGKLSLENTPPNFGDST